jgi:opacity protein-like surface antigen
MEEAENNSDSSNHEKAWEKMELLLDEHLPVKKKRRRFIFLLFPLLLAGGIALFFLQKNNTDHSISQQENSTIQNPVSSSKTTIAPGPAEKISSDKNNDSAPVSDDLTSSKTTPTNRLDQLDQSKTKDNLAFDKITTAKSTKKLIGEKRYMQPQKTLKNKVSIKYQTHHNISDDKDLTSENVDPTAKSNEEKKNIDKITATKIDSNLIAKTPAIDTSKSKTDTAFDKATVTAKKVSKKKSSFSKKLSLSFSFGPDVSSVGIDRPGKLALPYGIGVSYALSKNISVRTGFFVARKIYDADSADYHPPSNFWTYYSNLQKIDANCLVYEIPLSVVYNFASAKKHNWFVSGGLSTYLMKKEKYEYNYKNPWGQPQVYYRTYKNENSHIFSVLNLSGGYQYHLNDRVSVMGEPYIKIPVSGVGYGKVKLNSAGVMFTVSVKPFLKKN